MAEYIEREKVLSEIKSCRVDLSSSNGDLYVNDGINEGLTEASVIVKDAPAADVRSVKHGYWIPLFLSDSDKWLGLAANYECSECNGEVSDITYSRGLNYEFCPRCGAKMDGKDDQQEELK